MPLDPNYGQRAQTSKVEGWRDAHATRQLVVFLLVVLVAVALWPLAVAFDCCSAGENWTQGHHEGRESERIRESVNRREPTAVLAILLLSPLINSFLAEWSARFPPWGVAEPVVPIADIIARENAAVVSAIVPLLGIAVTFAVIAALSRSAPPPSFEVDDATAAADRIFGSQPSSEDERLRDAPPPPRSAAAKSFNEPTYRVRPQPMWLAGFLSYFNHYDIRGGSLDHYSYSMRSGSLQRVWDGAVMLSISRRAASLMDTFEVVDSETGRPVGSFRSRATGWDINDTLGRPVLFGIRDIEESIACGTSPACRVARCAATRGRSDHSDSSTWLWTSSLRQEALRSIARAPSRWGRSSRRKRDCSLRSCGAAAGTEASISGGPVMAGLSRCDQSCPSPHRATSPSRPVHRKRRRRLPTRHRLHTY